MSKLKVLGFYREKNKGAKADSDKLIAEAVKDELLSRNYSVSLLNDFDGLNSTNIIFSLSRNLETLDKLNKIKNHGVLIINPPESVKICINRKDLFTKLFDGKVPIPKTKIVSIKDCFNETEFPFFLKDGDNHFGDADEKFLIKSSQDLNQALNCLHKKGVKNVLIQEYVKGKEIKFYGIGNTILLPPTSLEQVSQIELSLIRKIALKATTVLKTDVFGGDIIFTKSNAVLIDFNEWPSFSTIREKAAVEICNLIEQKARDLPLLS
ncbi:MAG: hypothetical protein PHD95_01780 [Candidatus ainarchaeum sp.]|nr:hypothetical protein [Candidatus ainarchaeum sp.]